MRQRAKFFVGLAALLLAAWMGPAGAATTGKITGIVRDGQTGEALPGANVVIDGTQRGATTDANGYYIILLVDPGTYSLTASMVGYDPQKKTEVKVQSDFTTTVNFEIREMSLQLGEITVVAQRPPVEPDKTTSQYMMSETDLQAVPIVRNMKDFVELQAGVSINSDGSDISVRGGNTQDVAYVIDGVRVTTTDSRSVHVGLGSSLNKSAVQELQVITGGYNAEYGNAQGGVVSMVTRDGGANYNGLVDYQFTPSGQKHWGANVYDSPINRGNNKWDDPTWVAQSIEIPADLNGDGVNDVVQAHRRVDYTGQMGHRIEANLSGPVTKDMTFFASSVWQHEASDFPSPDLTTPFNTSNTGKLTYTASPNVKLRVGGIYDSHKGTFGGPTQGGALNVLDNGHNLFLYVPDPTGHYRDTDAMYYASITHSLSPKTFYEAKLALSTTSRDTTDMPQHYIVDQDLTSNPVTDGTYTIYRETTNWSLYNYKRIELKADLSSQVNKQNFVKAGFDMIHYDNWYQQFWSDGPSSRHVRWFSHDYTSSAFWPGQSNQGLNPISLALYLQDKIEFEGMIVNAGVRGNMFFQNTDMIDAPAWLGQNAPWNDMTRALVVPTIKGPTIKSFEPRLGVSHPITDKSLVRFFYGKFDQLPQFYQLFENQWQSNEGNDKDLNGNGVIDPAERYNEFNDPGSAFGTPYIPSQETVSFEMGMDWNFVSDYVMGITTYYKQESNGTSDGGALQWVDPKNNTYVTGVGSFAPGVYEDVRGFEINLRKKFSNMFSFNVGYNLQWADGGNDEAARNDVWPDSQFVANGYYWLNYDVDPTTGAEVPVSLTEQATREGLDPNYYIQLYGHQANQHLQSMQASLDAHSNWSWIPWYSHYSEAGVQAYSDRPADNSNYTSADKAYWEEASAWPGNPGSGEGNLLAAHSQETGERVPLSADRRNFGSMTFLFATPGSFGPFGGKALGNLRANLVYRLYTGAEYAITVGGIQEYRYGPIHTRMDLNAEKVFGKESGVNITLAVEVYNLFNQKDPRQNALSGRPVDFNTTNYQLYGITGLLPTNSDIATFNLSAPELNDISDYWDTPRQMDLSVRIKW